MKRARARQRHGGPPYGFFTRCQAANPACVTGWPHGFGQNGSAYALTGCCGRGG